MVLCKLINPTYMYLSNLRVYFKVELYFKVT